MEYKKQYGTAMRLMTHLMMALMLLVSIQVPMARAAMVPTDALIQSDQTSYSQSELMQAVNSQELRGQLEQMGVDPEQLGERIASLTPAEIAELNDHLQQQPAGSNVLGVLLVIFVVFVVTDMLCATDLFTFVRCINR